MIAPANSEISRQMILDAKSGDGLALQLLLQRVAPLLKKQLHGRIPAKWASLVTIEDLLQDTFVKAVDNIAGLRSDEPAAFVAWIKQIAESELATVLRRAQLLKHGGNRNQLLPGPVTGGSAVILLGEVEARSPGPRSWVAREEAVDRLRLGISALPMDQRRVVELCNAQGMNRADVGNLLIHADQQVRDRQLRELSQIIKSDLFRLVRQLIPLTDGVDVRARLPLVEMALPGLAATSSAQYTEFQTGFESLARADGQLDLFESMLGQVVKRHLRPRFEPMRAPQAGYASLGRLADRCAVVISALAYAGNADADAQLAFEAAANVVAGCRPCCQAR